MSFPTTSWGNSYDVYPTIPGPTSSSPGSSDGPVLGVTQRLADDGMIQFVQFLTATSTGANHAVIAKGSFAAYAVTDSSATQQLVIGVNDLSGGSATNQHSATSSQIVLVNNCAWITRKGLCFPLVEASVSADVMLVSMATAGVLDDAVAGTDLQSNIVNLVVVGGSQAVSPALMV